MNYHFKIHKDKDSLWAECIELKGCVTQSYKNTMEDLRSMMEEALNAYLNEPGTSKTIFPYPDESCSGKNVELVKVHSEVAFALIVRQYRLENNYTQMEMAKRLNMKNIIIYQRLEKKGDPKLSTIARIKNIFPDIPFEKYLF